MSFASEVRFCGQAVRDGELASTPEGKPVVVMDMAIHEDKRTVYVPVLLENALAVEISRQRTMGESFFVAGRLWRPAKSVHVPYPQLMVVAHVFRKLAKVEQPGLFEEALG